MKKPKILILIITIPLFFLILKESYAYFGATNQSISQLMTTGEIIYDVTIDTNPNYIENNVFSTGHQSVNVYGLPEKRYEVRTEDNAVDIQIHRDAPKAVILSTEQPSTSSGGVSDVPTI